MPEYKKSASPNVPRREYRQIERARANLVGEFLARRNKAISVGRDKQLHLDYHLCDNRQTAGYVEGVRADIRALGTITVDHRVDFKRHNRRLGNEQQNVRGDGYIRRARITRVRRVKKDDV
jgi:hypothetical protein